MTSSPAPDTSRAPYVSRTDLESFLPSDARALWSDGVGWVLCLCAATLVRTLLSTHHILYPRMLGIGIGTVIFVQIIASRLTRRYWPWASLRGMRFLWVTGLGSALGLCLLDAAAGVRLLPWSAALIGTLLAIVWQWLLRRGWHRAARRAALAEMGHA